MKSVYKKMVFINSFLTTSLITSIRVIYMLNYLTSVDQIASLKGIFSIVVSLSEIPTGVIADKISKKLSMEISAILFALHAVFYVVLPNFVGFTLSQIFLGLSGSFLSGADDGYLDDYIIERTTDDYLSVAGKIQHLCGYGKATMFLLSGFIFAFNPKLNFIITFIFGVFSLFIIYSLPEIGTDIDNNGSKEKISKYLIETINVVKYNFKNSFVLKITLLSSIVTSFLIFNFEYYQVFLEKFNFSNQLYGLLYASFMVIGGYGAKISKTFLEKFGINNLFGIIMSLIAVSYILIGFSINLYMIFIAIFIQQLCFGSWGLIVTNILLKNLPEQSVKSTMLSVNNSVISLLKAFIVIILGRIYLTLGVRNLYLIMSIIMIAAFIVIQLKDNLKRNDK